MQNAKILLIDDEPGIAHMVKLVCETTGHLPEACLPERFGSLHGFRL